MNSNVGHHCLNLRQAPRSHPCRLAQVKSVSRRPWAQSVVFFKGECLLLVPFILSLRTAPFLNSDGITMFPVIVVPAYE
jgi:hypothetical protein